jgi:hypothetical protein
MGSSGIALVGYGFRQSVSAAVIVVLTPTALGLSQREVRSASFSPKYLCFKALTQNTLGVSGKDTGRLSAVRPKLRNPILPGHAKGSTFEVPHLLERAMSRSKDKTLSIRTTDEVKSLLRLAAQRERRSIASMVEILVLSYASEHDLRIRSAVPQGATSGRKARPGEVSEQ